MRIAIVTGASSGMGREFVKQVSKKEKFDEIWEWLTSFVLSYSRALNRELKTKGIRVMSVNPGWVKTEFFDHATKSSNDAITYFNVMYDAKDVIKTAIRDLYHTKKDVSIHGFQIKAQVLLVKLLPHKIVMEIWMRQQKHK